MSAGNSFKNIILNESSADASFKDIILNKKYVKLEKILKNILLCGLLLTHWDKTYTYIYICINKLGHHCSR